MRGTRKNLFSSQKPLTCIQHSITLPGSLCNYTKGKNVAILQVHGLDQPRSRIFMDVTLVTIPNQKKFLTLTLSNLVICSWFPKTLLKECLLSSAKHILQEHQRTSLAHNKQLDTHSPRQHNPDRFLLQLNTRKKTKNVAILHVTKSSKHRQILNIRVLPACLHMVFPINYEVESIKP